jgi:hypothetical protein
MSAAITAAARLLRESSAAPRKKRETKRQSVYKPARHIIVRSPRNTTRKSPNKSPNKEPSAASAAKVSERVGNLNKTKQAIKNAVAAAASKRQTASNRQSVVTVAIPKNDPGLLAIIRRLLGRS